uniref:Uncharacterized protein n=1 Tax=Anopheles culicifacies TaxID=139723 RepID=A0A182M336_9DIPT
MAILQPIDRTNRVRKSQRHRVRESVGSSDNAGSNDIRAGGVLSSGDPRASACSCDQSPDEPPIPSSGFERERSNSTPSPPTHTGDEVKRLTETVRYGFLKELNETSRRGTISASHQLGGFFREPYRALDIHFLSFHRDYLLLVDGQVGVGCLLRNGRRNIFTSRYKGRRRYQEEWDADGLREILQDTVIASKALRCTELPLGNAPAAWNGQAGINRQHRHATIPSSYHPDRHCITSTSAPDTPLCNIWITSEDERESPAFHSHQSFLRPMLPPTF